MVNVIAIKKNYSDIANFESDTYDWEIYLPPVKNMQNYDVGHVFAVTASIEFWLNRNKFINKDNENQVK